MNPLTYCKDGRNKGIPHPTRILQVDMIQSLDYFEKNEKSVRGIQIR